MEQNSSGPQAVSSGKNMHRPAKQVLVVHPTPSSQSAWSQHSAQSPPQHFSGLLQLGAAAHVPSTVQMSFVQTSSSSQSSGPPHALLPPFVPALPAWLPPPVPAAGLPPMPLSLPL
jgi:hypothetical protein